ncbi:MAG: glycosyltransferase [Gemmatimonadota bacterium]
MPFPPDEGALIRSYHTVRLLSREYEVSGIYFWRRAARESAVGRARSLEELRRFGSADAFPIPQEHSRIRLVWDHARSAFTGTPYTRWMHESRAARRWLEEILSMGSFDVVHVDSIDLLAYLASLPSIPLVLAHHNVESALLRRRAEHAKGPARAYLRFQAALVEAAEREWCSRAELNIAVSDQDAEQFLSLAPRAQMLVIPNGVDTQGFRPLDSTSDGGVVFVGGHSWLPNADGMEFFVAEVLPLILRERPETRVRWIGKAPEGAARHFARQGVEVLGYVDDIRPVMGEAQCVIVPLRIGGGTRLKILDAWAMGKAVVSTSIGSEGLKTCDGENILIADSPDLFAAAVLRVLGDPSLRKRLETAARETAERNYDWERLGDRMLERYRSIVALGGRRD